MPELIDIAILQLVTAIRNGQYLSRNMGFSQNQMMKDLLVANMKKQGKYTPQMRKAINVFFGNGTEKEISIDDMSNDEVKVFISALIPTISPSLFDDEMGQKYISEIMELLTKEENIPLLVKLVKNQLTVADQQAIIDIMFSNETFREYTKSSLENPENSEWIIKATQHDMKLRVETNPDSFMNGGGTDAFQYFDFFEMLLKRVYDNLFFIDRIIDVYAYHSTEQCGSLNAGISIDNTNIKIYQVQDETLMEIK